MIELNERETLQGREVLLGGIVTGFREGMTRTESLTESWRSRISRVVARSLFSDRDYIEYSKYGKIGMYLLITAV